MSYDEAKGAGGGGDTRKGKQKKNREFAKFSQN